MRNVAGPPRQQGAVIITVCLLMLFLLGFMGFALDYGRLFIVKTELQTALDSCALSAAHELDRPAGAIARARSAGMTAGNLNHVNLQSVTWSGKGKITEEEITFRDQGYVPTSADATAVYAECQHTQPAVQLWLMQALGAFSGNDTLYPGTQNVAARAVATRSSAQSTCPLPIALRPKTAGAPPPNYGYTRGEWVTLLMSASTGQNGYIGWANLDGSNNAAETVEELSGGSCATVIGQALGTPGVQQAVAVQWNYRFGLYRPAGNPAVNPPDFTGYSYTTTNWPSGQSAYDGPVPTGAPLGAANFKDKRQQFASCADTTTSIGDCEALIGRTLNSFQRTAVPGASVSGGHWQYGSNRRVALVPVTTTYPGTVEDYACMLMLQPMNSPPAEVQLEFIGNAAEPDSPCTTNGLPGGSAGPLVPVLVR